MLHCLKAYRVQGHVSHGSPHNVDCTMHVSRSLDVGLAALNGNYIGGYISWQISPEGSRPDIFCINLHLHLQHVALPEFNTTRTIAYARNLTPSSDACRKAVLLYCDVRGKLNGYCGRRECPSISPVFSPHSCAWAPKSSRSKSAFSLGLFAKCVETDLRLYGMLVPSRLLL